MSLLAKFEDLVLGPQHVDGTSVSVTIHKEASLLGNTSQDLTSTLCILVQGCLSQIEHDLETCEDVKALTSIMHTQIMTT